MLCVEIPACSDLWRFLGAAGLWGIGHSVTFCQRMYGLQVPGEPDNMFICKRTRLATTCSALNDVHRHCDHSHIHRPDSVVLLATPALALKVCVPSGRNARRAVAKHAVLRKL